MHENKVCNLKLVATHTHFVSQFTGVFGLSRSPVLGNTVVTLKYFDDIMQ